MKTLRWIQKTKIGNALLKPSTMSADKSIFQSGDKAVEFLKKAIEDADHLKSKLISPKGNEVLHLFGQSSERIRHLLNNLCSVKDVNYLEIGTYQGATFISANYGNTLNSLVIDNWSQFGSPSFMFFQNAQVHIGGKYKIIWRDCWQVKPEEVIEKFGNGRKAEVYLYDADHSYESQYKAFTHYNDIFIAIVDDYNDAHVEKGTQDAFKELGYKVLYERHLPARYLGDSEQWWNGYYVAVVSKK